MPKSKRIGAGKLINTHGVAGEVKVEVWLDSPQYMKTFKRFFIGEKEFTVLSSRIQKGFLYLKLSGVEDLNAAQALKGSELQIDRDDAHLPAGSYFLCDIIGARVMDEQGSEVGILEDIEENPAAPIYVVKGEKEHLIPDVPEFIRKVDAEQGIVTVHLIEGM